MLCTELIHDQLLQEQIQQRDERIEELDNECYTLTTKLEVAQQEVELYKHTLNTILQAAADVLL